MVLRVFSWVALHNSNIMVASIQDEQIIIGQAWAGRIGAGLRRAPTQRKNTMLPLLLFITTPSSKEIQSQKNAVAVRIAGALQEVVLVWRMVLVWEWVWSLCWDGSLAFVRWNWVWSGGGSMD